MTKQESFKRRVRARMDKTGERYAAARQALLDRGSNRNGSGGRVWMSQPESGDAAVTDATGRGWDEWCDLIERWPGRDQGHTAIAAYLQNEVGLDGWWAQQVTGGYERITGRRLPHQQADGTFTANKSRTVVVDATALRAALLDEEQRRDLFPHHRTVLRSKPASKSIRLEIGPGVVQIAIEGKGDDRAKVVVSHERLPTFDNVEEWKFYWAEWLEAIDG